MLVFCVYVATSISRLWMRMFWSGWAQGRLWLDVGDLPWLVGPPWSSWSCTNSSWRRFCVFTTHGQDFRVTSSNNRTPRGDGRSKRITHKQNNTHNNLSDCAMLDIQLSRVLSLLGCQWWVWFQLQYMWLWPRAEHLVGFTIFKYLIISCAIYKTCILNCT